jgi:hypothetical protein
MKGTIMGDNPETVTGGCLCGAVRYEITEGPIWLAEPASQTARAGERDRRGTMKAKRLLVPMLVMLFLAALAFPAHTLVADEIISPMGGSDKANCQSVHAVQEKKVYVGCPAGQTFDLCFTGKMVDRAGVITGHIEYFEDPSKEAALQHAPGQFQYSGTVKYVTKSGVLRAEENGIWDSKTKDYAGLVTISGGTGDFEGATGKLAAFGNSRGAGMVIGTICK